jgi:pyridoxamine 5'-phosphate oxidase
MSTSGTGTSGLRISRGAWNKVEPHDLSALRQEYSAGELDLDSTDPSPFLQFAHWFRQAQTAQLIEPNAMVLSTVSDDLKPSQRTVLLKYFDKEGLVFFTNYGSRKSKQIHSNANVSLLFPWYSLQRQVEISGTAEAVSRMESLKYFASRPRDSQLGAWVSQQSSVVSSRSLITSKWEEFKRKFADGDIPIPEFWGGYRVRPHRFEFWQGRPSRLHDRIEYLLEIDHEQKSQWLRQRLFP